MYRPFTLREAVPSYGRSAETYYRKGAGEKGRSLIAPALPHCLGMSFKTLRNRQCHLACPNRLDHHSLLLQCRGTNHSSRSSLR